MTTESRSRPTPSPRPGSGSQKQDSISSTPLAGEGKRILSRKDAGEIIAGEELAKPSNRLLAHGRIVRAHEAEGLVDFASFSAQPPHPRLRSPRQFTTRSESVHAFNVGEGAVPQDRVADRPVGTAELPEHLRRFSKADNEEIEVDLLLHAAHCFHHAERIERVAKGMGRRELRADFPRTDHEF